MTSEEFQASQLAQTPRDTATFTDIITYFTPLAALILVLRWIARVIVYIIPFFYLYLQQNIWVSAYGQDFIKIMTQEYWRSDVFYLGKVITIYIPIAALIGAIYLFWRQIHADIDHIRNYLQRG